jgi:hypothetical protein
LTLAGYAALRLCGRLRPWEYALAVVVGLALVWQLISIAPYTAFYPREMSDSRAEGDSNRISLLVYNVLSDNREVEALRNFIRDTDPDIILLSEFAARQRLGQCNPVDHRAGEIGEGMRLGDTGACKLGSTSLIPPARSTLLPRMASPWARLTAVVVFPTPPLAIAIAIFFYPLLMVFPDCLDQPFASGQLSTQKPGR